ncbi:MAG: NAD(+)/NADH kinase [Blastocatellia bacterium]|nr:NAD(+)/NADH kinase [Blastocatellia bacterium]
MSSLQLRTIGVVVKPRMTEAIGVVRDLQAWCLGRGIEMRAKDAIAEQIGCVALATEGEELREDVDLIVVLGGDGTMLGASRLVGSRQIPVLGVNFGSLGYLTEFALRELYPTLEGLLAGSFSVEKRMLLDVRILREDGGVESHRALNEAVVTETAPTRMIELECLINGMFVNGFRSDGMIVATPTGSTAYSLSAGGPIVHPAMSAILLTPVCPHMLSNRPVIVPGDSVIEIVFRDADAPMLTIDGQVSVPLQPGDRIQLCRSRTTFDLVRPENRNYFEVLRTKLKWGAR